MIKIVIKTLFLLLVSLLILILIEIFRDKPTPIFTLEDKTTVFQITKRGSNYWLQEISNPQSKTLTLNSKIEFKGSAIKIRGATFNLDEYLDQDVSVTGIFSTTTGEHTYYLTSIKKL